MVDHCARDGGVLEPLGPISGKHCNPIRAQEDSKVQEERTSTVADIDSVELAATLWCNAG